MPKGIYCAGVGQEREHRGNFFPSKVVLYSGSAAMTSQSTRTD